MKHFSYQVNFWTFSNVVLKIKSQKNIYFNLMANIQSILHIRPSEMYVRILFAFWNRSLFR